MTRIRRVVAGVDSQGRSVFTSDEVLSATRLALLNGNELLRLFGEDGLPTVPDGALVQEDIAFLPPTSGGYRFFLMTFPPATDRAGPKDPVLDAEAMERFAPGMAKSPRTAGMFHYTPTVDLEYVIAGEITLLLDGGESKVLHAGDTLIMCGTTHAWQNRSAKPAVVLAVFIGAREREDRV